jgi:hypothetical protein
MGKFKENERVAVRNHGLLGWNFNTTRGIASLLILPDDGNDTNTVKTGHKIWINPPSNPDKILKEGTYFTGPRLTIISDSLGIRTLKKLANRVDKGGAIHIIGKQFAHLKEFETTNPNHRIYFDTLRRDPVYIPAGTDTKVLLQPILTDSLPFNVPNTWRLEVLSEGFKILYTNWHKGIWPYKDSLLSLAVLNTPLADSLSEPPFCKTQDEICNTLLWSSSDSTTLEDSTRMVLNSPKQGQVFYRDNEPWELIVKKVSFLHWDGTLE